MNFIENAWYRISIKALINNDKGEILLCKENNGVWDIPGGGLNHGEDVYTCIQREIYEEMGLKVTEIDTNPSYFITAHKPESKSRPWIANICYNVKVKDLRFKQSQECIEIGFFSLEEMIEMNTIVNVKELGKIMINNKKGMIHTGYRS